MSKNRYVFETTLDGFIQVYEDSGKFNNRCFSFVVPESVLGDLESDREELLDWARSKANNPRRVEVALPKWDDEGLIKYSYGGDTKRAEPVFVDTEGSPLEREVLKGVRKGTKVKLILQQSPYLFGQKIGTKFRVLGVQIIELVTGNGAADSGDLSVEDVAAIFGEAEGFKQAAPQVRKANDTKPAATDDYDF